MLQERHKVGHAHNVHRAADPVAVKCRDRQRHVPAVASAGHCNPLAVQPLLRRYPVEQGVDVLVRIFALESVV